MLQKRGAGADEAVGETLKRVAREIIDEARDALAPDRADAAAVHDYRKAMKRWRALLRLLEPFLDADARQLRTDARDLAHVLAGARNSKSALEALEDLAGEKHDFSARSLATIRGRLESIRKTAEANTLTPAVRKRIEGSLDQAAAAITGWRLEDVGFADVSQRLAETYRKVRGACPRDWLAADAETLHDLRSRVVVHRYQMELVEPLWPRLGRVWVAEAQRLRDRLGKHHDLAELEALTMPRQPLAPWRSRLGPLIAARQAKLAKSSRRIAGRLLAEKPKAFRRRLEALWEHRHGG